MRWTNEQYQEYLSKAKGIKSNSSKNKYNNKKTVVDGITFDSQKEANYYCQLRTLSFLGKIKYFKTQQKYILQDEFEKNGVKHRPITYIADFVVNHHDGTTEVIDVKGMETQVFKIKRKMFEYKYPELKLKIVK